MRWPITLTRKSSRWPSPNTMGRTERRWKLYLSLSSKKGFTLVSDAATMSRPDPSYVLVKTLESVYLKSSLPT